jgi:predicted ribosomally synthesized peptide with nif11-like leader
MSMESAREFLDKLKTDGGFADRVGSASLEQRRRIVKDEGFDLTFEEVEAAANVMSADDLAQITGGQTYEPTSGPGTTGPTSPTSPTSPTGPKTGYAGNCYGRMYGCTNGCEGVSAW